MDENVNPEDLPLDEQVAILIAELPKPVQDFLHSPERDAVSSELSTKYALHADQAGVFERSYIYMLLGVYTPDEFVQELRDAHIAEETIRGLTTDVNERVFKKLQGAERNPPPPPVSAPIPPPIPLSPKPAAPAPFISTPMAKPFSPSPAPKPVPAPLPAAPVAPIYVPPAPAAFATPPVSVPETPPKPVFATPAAQVEHPAIRTMAHDMEAMKEESKHPHQAFPAPKAPVAPPAWQPASPARTFQTSSVPNTASAPQPMPFTPPPAPIAPAPVPPPAPPVPLRPFSMPTPPPNLPGQPANTHPLTAPPIVKEYSVDPYRETPE